MIRACGRQLRAGFGGAYGLDFPAVFAMGEALGADRGLLAEVLPSAEAVILSALREEAGDGEA